MPRTRATGDRLPGSLDMSGDEVLERLLAAAGAAGFLVARQLGVVEALGAGCVPDPQRAASYIPAYGMIILTLVLLLKPTGLFGREL